MSVHLQREIDKLKHRVISLSSSVEQNMRNAIQAVAERDNRLAADVIINDNRIDEIEVEVEEECLKILALHQPVAIDLRYIVSILKIDHDLERISDLAVNIAESTIALEHFDKSNYPCEIETLGRNATDMVKRSLDALINLDEHLARDIWQSDDKIDEDYMYMTDVITHAIKEHPESLNELIHLLNICRNIERIADHAANIAKDVIYLVEGKIVRHKGFIYKQSEKS